jgi:hypothetical protein
MTYATREYDPVTIRRLLVEHPDIKAKGDGDDLLRRLRIVRFFLQAGWYDGAEEEVAAVARDFPEEKEKVETAREQVRRLKLLEVVKEVSHAHEAGRGRWVQDVLAAVSFQGIDEKQQTRLRGLRSQYEAGRERIALAQRHLSDVPPRIEQGSLRELFTQAAANILAELTHETAGRLDAFASLAQQAERDRKQNRKPAHAPEQLMALAVSGWLLGNSLADTRVDVAVRLWRGRMFVLDYLRTPGAVDRRMKLQAFQKDNPTPVDEIAQMLRLLPPPEYTSDQWPAAGTQWAAVTANVLAAPARGSLAAGTVPLPVGDITRPPDRAETLKFQADVPWSQRRGATYFVQLPLEYQPGRLYPVLVALHHTSEGAEDILKRWGPWAATRGYVLVAPAWMRGFRNTYDFTPEEHANVLDVLWEVRRRFWVDADRVFLTGFGDGANMAFDVGLSHPHVFAGVLPMGGTPRYFARTYKHNGQYLPLYIVEGDRNGTSPSTIRELCKTWLPRGYPVLYVEYKGRVFEWFAGEVPNAFDWMSRKKRLAAFPELGRGGGTTVDEGYASMRPTDNRFYWLTADGLASRHHNDASKWNNLTLPATMSARIGEGNALSVTLRGFKRGTVWLGPGMIDFEKPVTLRYNGGAVAGKRAVKPSLETLLEDLYTRGDRQRVYWARMDVGG